MDTRKELLVDLLTRLTGILDVLETNPHKPDPDDKVFWLVTEAVDVVEEELDRLD